MEKINSHLFRKFSETFIKITLCQQLKIEGAGWIEEKERKKRKRIKTCNKGSQNALSHREKAHTASSMNSTENKTQQRISTNITTFFGICKMHTLQSIYTDPHL
jgi:hypothetical protein